MISRVLAPNSFEPENHADQVAHDYYSCRQRAACEADRMFEI